MRKSFMLSIAALCFGIASADTYGPDASGQTWTYTVNGDAVTLTGVGDKTITVDAANIPWVIDGKPVTTVGSQAFRYWANLTGTLAIPDSVTKIELAAFSDCTGLTGIACWGGITTWGDWAFRGCKNMIGAFPDLSNTVALGGYMLGDVPLTGTLKLNPELTLVPRLAFDNCAFGGTAVVPASVETVGHNSAYGTFCGNPNLEAVWVKGKATGTTTVWVYNFAGSCKSLEMVLMGKNTNGGRIGVNTTLPSTSGVEWFAPANATWDALTTSTIGGTGNKVWKYGPDEDFDLEIDDVAMTATITPKTADALVNALAWAPKFKRLFNLDTVISITGSITVPEGAITAEMLQCVKLDSPSWFMTFAVKTQAQLDAVLAAVDGSVVIDITGSKEEITVPEGRSVAVLVPGGAAFNYRRRGLIIVFK